MPGWARNRPWWSSRRSVVAATTTLLSTRFQQGKSLGGIVSTSVSALFLFVIAITNLFIRRSIWRTYRHVRNGGGGNS